MSEQKRPIGIQSTFNVLIGAAAAGAAVSAAGLAALYVINGWQSGAEFNTLNGMARVAIENGDLTDKDGSPKTYEVKLKNQKYAIVVSSALQQNAGNFSNTAGQNTSSSTTSSDISGITQSNMYTFNYTVKGTVYRLDDSKHFARIFFDDGGSRAYSFEWQGTKPTKAPLSRAQIFEMRPVELAPANPQPQ